MRPTLILQLLISSLGKGTIYYVIIREFIHSCLRNTYIAP
jgi:siroheme synthase (precorrin-2 oxidase/ferrochelatase)